MSGFLYFLPNERTYQPTHLVEYGLQHIVDAGVGILQQQVIRGPGCQPGVLIGAEDQWTQGDVKWSDQLKHRPFPKPHAAKQAMCCWLDGKLPAANVLARTKQLPGQYLTLADGNKWLVPHARRWLDDGMYASVIPKVIGVDEETGEYIAKDVAIQYRELNRLAEEYFSAYLAAAVQAGVNGQASIVIDDPIAFMFAALSANYRVSATELDVLGAVDEMAFGDFAAVIMDRKSIEPIQKKTE